METRGKSIVVWGVVCALLIGAPAMRALWTTDGTPICTADGGQGSPEFVTDGAGGAIVVWQDTRRGEYDIYAQRIDERGASVWVTDGVAVCTVSGSQSGQELISDGAGGAIIAWRDSRADGRGLYAQRLDAAGNMMWPDTGVVVCDAPDGSRLNPKITTDGSGGAIVVWVDDRGTDKDLFAQRVDANGNPLWDPAGVAITRAEDTQQEQQIMTDGVGGAFIVWQDNRDILDIYAQRVDADGDTLWAEGGIPICQATDGQRNPTLTSDGAGGVIMAWEDQRISSETQIYAQRVDADGDTRWAVGGVLVCTRSVYQFRPVIVSDGSGGAILLWRSGGSAANYDVHAQRIDANGNPLWTSEGIVVCSADESQDFVSAIPDASGGAILAWEDQRNNNFSDIYAQRISPGGSALWTSDGVAICTAPFDQKYPRLLTDGSGGAMFVWQDSRGDDADIYGSLADATGQLVPTLLKAYDVGCRDGAIVVRWSVSSTQDDHDFAIFRTFAAGERAWMNTDITVEGEDGKYEFRDESCVPGSSYRYRVDVTDETGRRTLFETDPVTAPGLSMVLYQNAPNPFNPTTAIWYSTGEEARVSIRVYNAAGHLVRTLVDQQVNSGRHVVTWDGLSDSGKPVSSGIYFCRLESRGFTQTRKLTLLR